MRCIFVGDEDEKTVESKASQVYQNAEKKKANLRMKRQEKKKKNIPLIFKLKEEKDARDDEERWGWDKKENIISIELVIGGRRLFSCEWNQDERWLVENMVKEEREREKMAFEWWKIKDDENDDGDEVDTVLV